MAIETFNGAQIIALPSAPASKSIELGMNDAVSLFRSPYTAAQQVQAWPGSDWWDATIALPQMQRPNAAVWSAWLASLRGMQNVFPLTDYLHRQPQGCASGADALVADGVQNALGTTLNTRGWTANTARLLVPGDLLQLGTSLHRVLNVVSSDTNGKAPISIWPCLRVATTDGQALILNNPCGLFRLAENRRSVLSNETRLSGISFKAMEAR